jgi:replicative DNA helicase
MAQHMSVVSKKKIGFFSLEMSREELVDRLLVGQADIDAWKLGLKSMYYQHSMNAAQKFKQKKECISCEG